MYKWEIDLCVCSDSVDERQEKKKSALVLHYEKEKGREMCVFVWAKGRGGET